MARTPLGVATGKYIPLPCALVSPRSAPTSICRSKLMGSHL